MKNSLLILFFSLFVSGYCTVPVNFSMVGFATADGGTTGGSGGKVVRPTTIGELKRYAQSPNPYIILIDREFSNTREEYVNGNNIIDPSGTLMTVNGDVIKLASNKTLLGVGNKAFLNRIAISIQCQSNIIIRNIRFTMKDVLITKDGENKIVGYRFDPDCISIQADDENIPKAERISQHIWIDHCEFYNEDPSVMTDYDRYDGLVDTKNNSINITISWCYFHDHHKACLIGKGASDVYDHKTTFHHNYYKKIESRLPLYRYGTGHMFNNYMEDTGNGINSRVNADVFIEKNYFYNTKKPVFGKPSENSRATLVDNRFMSCSRLPAIVGANDDGGKMELLSNSEEILEGSFVPSYDYSSVLNEVDDVPAIVKANAGIGIIDDIYTEEDIVDDLENAGGDDTGNDKPATGVTTVWNFSELSVTSVTSDFDFKGLSIIGISTASWTIEGNSKTFSGVSYSKRLKSGGAAVIDGSGSYSGRVLKVPVSGNGKLQVAALSSNSKESREYAVTDGNDELAVLVADGTATTLVSYEYLGDAKCLYLVPKAGINFYAVIWTPYITASVSEKAVKSALSRTEYYTVNGVKHVIPQKGLNIKKDIYEDGSVKIDKIFVK
ncbi:pectate lyase family protein [Coprobacter sp.]